MASLLEMLSGGNFGQPQYKSPLTAAVGQAQNVLRQPAPAPFQAAPAQRRGPGLLDTLWGVAAGYSPTSTRNAFEDRQLALQAAQLERDQTIARRDALKGFAGQFGGQPTPSGGQAGVLGAASAPAQTQAAGNPYDPRKTAAQLVQLQSLGVDTGPLRLALADAAPDVEIVNGVPVDKRDLSQLGNRVGGVDLANVNGFQVDPNDPRNTNKFFPEFEAGQAPVMEGSMVAGIRNLPGAVDSAAGRVRAVEDAKNASNASYAGVTAEASAAGQGRGAAPYAVETIQGPNGPITMSRAELLGMGPVQGVDTSTANARETRNEEDMQLAEASEGLARRVQNVQQQIQTGAFNLSPTAIAGYELDLTLGRNNPEAAQYGLFRSNVQEFVNENLRLNKGTQTEGDAQREGQAVLRNLNNPGYVVARMKEMQARNEQRSAQARQRVERRSPGTNQGLVNVTSLAQAQALPSGTRFRAPNGREYTKD